MWAGMVASIEGLNRREEERKEHFSPFGFLPPVGLGQGHSPTSLRFTSHSPHEARGRPRGAPRASPRLQLADDGFPASVAEPLPTGTSCRLFLWRPLTSTQRAKRDEGVP